jgi:FAD/FMN-containing dehydrogenase
MTAADVALRAAVEEMLGTEAVSETPDGRVVVSPDRTTAVSELLRWASREAVVVRTPPRRWLDGRRPFPDSGELLLRLDRLAGVLVLDRVSNVVTVPGGVTGAELAWRLHREGRWIRPRPRPFYTEPIGNHLAGPALASEMTALTQWESPLMGLEAVLADGRVMRAGVAPRSAAGPDYRAFLLGTGDRMGVITSVIWRTERRTVPMLFAAQVPETGAGLEILREHCRDGWRPWSSAVVRGDRELVLLCHRAEGERAAMLRRQLGAAVADRGGEVLEPSAARGWFEGSFLSWCKRGETGGPDADVEAAQGEVVDAWIAAPWPGLMRLWGAGVTGTGMRATVEAEGLRPEGGVLRVRMATKRATPGRLARAREKLVELAEASRGRVVGLWTADGSVEPAPGRGPASDLLDDMADELGPALNPKVGKGS